MENKELTVTNNIAPALMPGVTLLPVKQILEVIKHTHSIIREAMVEGIHYGVIPGTKKKVLFKPGAELMCIGFRARPTWTHEVRDIGNGHREYIMQCKLLGLNGEVLAEGIGSCSTAEKKYRYISAGGTTTGKPVPQEYWKAKKANDWQAMQAALGGAGFIAKKGESGWEIFEKSEEKIENPDIADVFNTAFKMSKKRSHVDATLTLVAGSDMFSQDLEQHFEEERDIYEGQAPTDAYMYQAQVDPVPPADPTPAKTWHYKIPQPGPDVSKEEFSKFKAICDFMEKCGCTYDADADQWSSPREIKKAVKYLVAN